MLVVDDDDNVGADGNMLIYVCNGGGDVGDGICVRVLLLIGILSTTMDGVDDKSLTACDEDSGEEDKG
jgi:hypothetical protein